MKILKKVVGSGFLWLCLVAGFPGCKPHIRILQSPPHYNFAEPTTYKLDLKLKEISGLAWDKDGHRFVTHNDEKGKLFFLDKDIAGPILGEVDFGDKGDYEDVAIADSTIYILRSDGVLTKFINDSNGKAHGIEYKLGLSGSKDFETMYYDDTRKSLIIICKNCGIDDKKTISAFAFHTDSARFDEDPVYVINAEEIKKMAPVKSSKFQPSAAAIHPVLKKLFIISSASNELVIADLDGNPESVYHLSKKLFPQPEGISFKGSGDMYISNEAVTSKSTIIKFKYIL